MPIYKDFDRDLHNRHDVQGRETVKNYVSAHKDGLIAKDNPDEYGVDLLFYKYDRLVGYGEVEVRTNWKATVFPFKSLHVPERKKKLLDNALVTLFFSVNEKHTQMFVCKAETVLNAPLVEVSNKYVQKGELFYDVKTADLYQTET